jgi:hypothetical protein
MRAIWPAGALDSRAPMADKLRPMRDEIKAIAADIQQSLELLRRHL